jgi:hypothetical protein
MEEAEELERTAEDLRRLQGSAVFREYMAICTRNPVIARSVATRQSSSRVRAMKIAASLRSSQ